MSKLDHLDSIKTHLIIVLGLLRERSPLSTGDRGREVNVELVDNVLVHVEIVVLLVNIVEVIVILIVVIVVEIVSNICH